MSSGFVSEKVLDEKRRQRQEEWEKVRKAEDPKEAPEEPQDNRSLYDKLQVRYITFWSHHIVESLNLKATNVLNVRLMCHCFSQANKAAKQEEWDEAHALKNQIRGIDDDEAEFLDEVDAIRSKMERNIAKEERRELEEHRERQVKK